LTYGRFTSEPDNYPAPVLHLPGIGRCPASLPGSLTIYQKAPA